MPRKRFVTSFRLIIHVDFSSFSLHLTIGVFNNLLNNTKVSVQLNYFDMCLHLAKAKFVVRETVVIENKSDLTVRIVVK